MPEINDDDVDRAYRAAVESSADDAAGRRPRRAAVLTAVQSLHVDPAVQAAAPGIPNNSGAANDRRWAASAAMWRGAAAACVVGASAMLVLHLRDEPEVWTRPDQPSTAERAKPAAPVAAGRAEAAAAETAAPSQARSSAPPPSRPPSPPLAPNPAKTPSASKAERPPQQRGFEPDRTLLAKPDAALAVAAPRSAFPGDAPQTADSAALDESASRSERVQDPGANHSRSAAAAPMPSLDSPAPEARDRMGQLSALAKAAPPRAKSAPAAAPEAERQADSRADLRGDLQAAVAADDLAAARRVLRTTKPDAERDPDQRTALALAVLRAHVPMVRLLFDSGADPLAQDRFGRTPLSYAEASGNAELLQALHPR